MRCTLTVICLLIFSLIAGLRGQDSEKKVFGECILPLGMEEGKIPDDAITASSSYESKSVGPQNARIRQEKNGGAWCPKAQISSAIREYLEIDLTKNHLIAWTETQGRFGNGQGQEYAEAFFLEYWRDAHWHQYKNLMGDRVCIQQWCAGSRLRCFESIDVESIAEHLCSLVLGVLRGNSNTYLVEKQKLDLPFVASRVRFVPYSQHPRTVCMRVEIYGCIWDQSLVSYSAPKASSPGPAGWNVQDSSYDGFEDDSLLIDGLGQLTDGILGDLSEIQSLSVMVGTNWVGWTDRPTVELIFRFQELREFENCSLHVARIPGLEVETFSKVRVLFSVDGQNYETEEEKLEASIDTSWTNANMFSATVPLQARIGRLVKIELSLAAKWLLLSEVTFYTVSGERNRSNDFDYSADRSRRVEQNHTEDREKWSNSASSTTSDLNETFYEIREDISTPDAFPVGTSQTYIGLVSGLLTIIVLSLSCAVFLLKQRGRNKVALLQKHTALLCDSSVPGIAISTKDRKLSNTITSGLSLIRKPITIAATTDRLQNRIGAQTNFQPSPNDLDSHQHSTVYKKTYKLFSEEDHALNESNVSTCEAESYLDFKCNSSITSKSSEFMMPCATTYTSKIMLQFQSGKLNQRIHEGYYAATDILTVKKRELLSIPSPFTPLHIRNKGMHRRCNVDPYHIPRISRHRLRILDKLGEGNVGLVHLCETKGITNAEAGSVPNRQTVILRSLWRGVVDSIRLDFTEDMQVLASLRNPNVAKMIALVEEEPFGAVFEYSEFGELPSFLESYGFSDSEASISGPGSALNFVIQIASAMKYLESMNIAHCDLAARNCIVAHKLTIKVSDHATYCNKYDHQYFIDGSNMKIPLRWMSWEAVIMGKHSSRADVWSFAVTVWEIFTNCKELPYANLTSAQVLENCNRWYRSDVVENKQIDCNDEKHQLQVPQQPDRCPDNIYRVMNRCWSKRIVDRPNFVEIHRYLDRLALD